MEYGRFNAVIQTVGSESTGVDAKKDHFLLDSFFEATPQKSQTRSVMRLCTRWRNDERVALLEMTSKVSRRFCTRQAPTQSVEKVHVIRVV